MLHLLTLRCNSRDKAGKTVAPSPATAQLLHGCRWTGFLVMTSISATMPISSSLHFTVNIWGGPWTTGEKKNPTPSHYVNINFEAQSFFGDSFSVFCAAGIKRQVYSGKELLSSLTAFFIQPQALQHNIEAIWSKQWDIHDSCHEQEV